MFNNIELLNFNKKHFVYENILVAGGRIPHKKWFRTIAQSKDVYCADKGIDICFRTGIIPKMLIGDMDSCDQTALQWAEKNHVKIKKLAREKDDTDFKLMLIEMLMQTSGNIVCTGVWGGRFDHLYSIIRYIFTAQINIERTLIMADQDEIIFFLHPALSQVIIRYSPLIKNISILPMDNEPIVDIIGAKWSLNHKKLSNEDVYSISNEPLVGQDIKINIAQGCVGVYLNFIK